MRKTRAFVIAAAIILAAVISSCAPSSADKPGPPYSHSDVQSGILGDSPAINCVEGEEDFLSARNAVTGEVYDNDVIDIGDSYCFYLTADIRNDNPDAAVVAEDVSCRFSVDKIDDTTYEVTAYVTSANTEPAGISDKLTFKSSKKFDLKYFPGTTFVRSHLADGAEQKTTQPDGAGYKTMRPEGNAALGDGVPAGIDALDGKIPGGDSVTVSIEVIVVR